MSSGSDGFDVTTFKWSPDRALLAYRAAQNTLFVTELYTVTAQGASNTRVNGSLVLGGDVSTQFYWLPDSVRLAYLADQETFDMTELYTVVADGTGNSKVNAHS